MKQIVAAVVLVASSLPLAHAACVERDLASDLRSADFAFVGTVIRSQVASDLSAIRSTTRPQDRRIRVTHRVAREVTLKGKPSRRVSIEGDGLYNPPGADTHVRFAELVRIAPGDSVLVMGTRGEPLRIGSCTASRRWDPETKKAVFAVLPPAP